jgi:hypothetical protein
MEQEEISIRLCYFSFFCFCFFPFFLPFATTFTTLLLHRLLPYPLPSLLLPLDGYAFFVLHFSCKVI